MVVIIPSYRSRYRRDLLLVEAKNVPSSKQLKIKLLYNDNICSLGAVGHKHYRGIDWP
jgi:hypothetical protein